MVPGPVQTGTSLRTSRTNISIRFLYVVVVQRLQCGAGSGSQASSAAGHPFARPGAGVERYDEATHGVDHGGDHAAEAVVRRCRRVPRPCYQD